MKSNCIDPLSEVSHSIPDSPCWRESASSWIGRTVPKRHRRDVILQSVGKVLSESRLSSLTMQDIADHLGISKGNLYYYFKDKQDILFQCRMRCMDLSLAALHDIQTEQCSQIDPLHTLLLRHITGMLENGFGGVLLTDLDNLTTAQRSHYVALRDEFESGVRHLIDTGVSQGYYACDDAKLASLVMLGAINWLPKWYRPNGNLAPNELATDMANFLMRALEHKDATRLTSEKRIKVPSIAPRHQSVRINSKPSAP